MNIEEFLQLSVGKWFCHRTTHDLAVNQSGEGKSDIVIETLALDNPEVIKLCQQHQIQPSLVSYGAKFSWNDTTKLNQKNTGSTVLVLVADADNPNQGKFLRQISKDEKTPVTGRYCIGSDEALILITESDTMSSEERLWFASPNLRMRVSILKGVDDFSMTSFTSEIRMGGTPPAGKSSEAAKSA